MIANSKDVSLLQFFFLAEKLLFLVEFDVNFYEEILVKDQNWDIGVGEVKISILVSDTTHTCINRNGSWLLILRISEF